MGRLGRLIWVVFQNNRVSHAPTARKASNARYRLEKIESLQKPFLKISNIFLNFLNYKNKIIALLLKNLFWPIFVKHSKNVSRIRVWNVPFEIRNFFVILRLMVPYFLDFFLCYTLTIV
jgi:hypothetical protein